MAILRMLEAASGEVCIVFLLRTTYLFPQEEKVNWLAADFFSALAVDENSAFV